MVGLLTAAGVASAAVVGLLAGIVWVATGAGALTTGAASALAVGAVLLDAAARRAGRPRPPAVRRQVPQLWGRLFGPGVVAVLYGSRLGVGPLTILTTWTWWAALLVGASLGPWPSAAVGAAFAISRTVTMLVAVAGTRTGPAMATRLSGVRRAQPVVSWVTALVLVLVVAACSGDDDGGSQVSGGSEGAEDRTELVLEPSTTAAPSPTTTAPGTTAAPGAADLAVLLVDQALPGFTRADEGLGAGPLDLESAAALESDTEAERALLETRGFQQGLSRAWVSAGEDVAYVAVYRFADATQAQGYLADGSETLAARGATPFPVPGVAGAVGFTTVEPDDQGTFTGHAVSFTRGADWFLVLTGSRSDAPTDEGARTLAKLQSDHLPTAG